MNLTLPFFSTDLLLSRLELPWGEARIITGPHGVVELDLCHRTSSRPSRQRLRESARAHRVIHSELTAYARGKLTRFSFGLDPHGTPFQRAVWNALLSIPFGATRTYGEIAAAIGHPNAARAVGAACRSNPIGLVIPCHRVIGRDGALTGYAGGLDLKSRLLRHEGALV
ncbi:MAG: methylated-DNA--[protein]-cysteine S-methyltransferase [Nitrospirae bacterium]|nr:methylated-DNA--[protein]-cysteine S-methyltransferase [Nitrospirota bacterium]